MILRVENLFKRFAGVIATDGLSFDVEQGSITALIGPNGAGKTTALNLITGVLQPQKGHIKLKDTEITGWPSYSIAARGLTRTYQNLQMFEGLTVLETVMVGAHRSGHSSWFGALLRTPYVRTEERALEQRALEALDRSGVARSDCDRIATELPYGMQRRVEIARAIASKPDLILLDEPAAGLNNRESETMASLIGDLRSSGMTILLVEHDMNLVMGVSDHVVVMNFGRLLSQGSPDQVQRDEAVIEAYLGKGEEESDALA